MRSDLVGVVARLLRGLVPGKGCVQRRVLLLQPDERVMQAARVGHGLPRHLGVPPHDVKHHLLHPRRQIHLPHVLRHVGIACLHQVPQHVRRLQPSRTPCGQVADAISRQASGLCARRGQTRQAAGGRRQAAVTDARCAPGSRS